MPTYRLSSETQSKVGTVITLVLNDPDFTEPWAALSPDEQKELVRHWAYALWDSISDGPEIATRAFVLALTDGTLGHFWVEKSPAVRKFALRCWEGVIRKVCAE
jgi:hypothetical protein